VYGYRYRYWFYVPVLGGAGAVGKNPRGVGFDRCQVAAAGRGLNTVRCK
jgi:hypothetical protein